MIMSDPKDSRWYAVCCKPRDEQIAEENLKRQGFQAYLPRIVVTRHRRGRWMETIEALFPRYVFVHINPMERSTAPIRSTRGAIDLVRFGGQPAIVPDFVIDELLERADPVTGLHVDRRPLLSPGERVRLVEGPLTGIEAIFSEQASEKRVIVLLELLGKSNKLSVSRDWVARAA
jgi:transcriptional antiterminator RfaH